MNRKLILGGSAIAVALVAFLLVTGSGGTVTKADAKVNNISTTTSVVGTTFYAQLQIDAEDDFICFPNCDANPVHITASAGDFISFNPLSGPFNFFGCYDNLIKPCETFVYTTVDSNGFGDNGINGDHCDSLFGPGDTHIAISTDGTGCGPTPNLDTTHLEQWWQAPDSFPGGTVTFTACQSSICRSTAITVLGAPATLDLKAMREATSNQATTCQGTPIYVIPAVEYTYNDFTSFGNFGNAGLCADVRDSNGSSLSGQNVIWTVSGGGCLAFGFSFTGPGSGLAYNSLASCSTGNTGDTAHVVATVGSATDSVDVKFGGDPASCTLMFSPDQPLAIGDTGHMTATFLDSAGNWVPDGIKAHFNIASSGDSSGNATLVSGIEDTVKGNIQGDVIAAISGVVVVSASIEHIAGPDTTCADEVQLSGNLHVAPIVCADPDMILNGFPPPAAGGFGTFEFCGGTWAQLYAASKCPSPMATSTAAFFYNTPAGGWAIWIPGTTNSAQNGAILALWPEQIPPHTIFTAKCV